MKILFRILIVFFLFIVVAIGAGFYFINSGQYRSLIEDAVADNTGYELTIAGDVALDMFPTFGLTLNDVRLRNPGARQELLSTSNVVLRLNVRELFAGRLLVEELVARNFHTNYYIDAEGNSSWAMSGSSSDGRTPNTTESETSDGDNDDLVNFSIERISIENMNIDYQDISQGVRYQIANFNLESQDTNLAGHPFELAIDFDFENNGMSEPVPLSLRSNVIADLNNGTINLNNLQFSVTPLLVQGEVSIVNFDRNMQFSGNLRADSFDVRGLLQTFAVLDADTSFSQPALNAEQMAAFAVEFSGNESEATIPDFQLNLGGADVNANGSIRFASDLAPMNISYSLMAGDIDLTPFMSTGEEPTDAAAEPAPSDETELPGELLSSMDLIGSASIASLTMGDFRFDDINVYTNIEDSVLDIEVTPVSAFAGTLAGSVRLNARSTTPTLESQLTINQFNLVDLSPALSRFNSFAGLLNLEASHSAQGATMSELLASLGGATTFNVANSSIDITMVKQVFTAIAALSPAGDTIQQWPDVVRFNELGGYLTFNEGLQANQDIKVRMDNFDITGSGGINLAEGSFDYDLLFTLLGAPQVQTIPVGERFQDVSWPVQCNAAFSAPVSQYCGPDFSQVRQIFTQLGTAAARSRLEEVITDQVPEDIQDSARGLLRNLLN